MSRFFKSAAFPILIVVVLAFFAQKLISPGDRTEPPAYSQFLTQVDSGKVKEATLSTKNNRVDVVLKNGTKYQTAYPDNTEQYLVSQLRAENAKVDVKPKGGSGWLTALTYILPFVIFLLFWLFIINQMQGGGSKVMSFGKSRAKRMSVDAPKITFRDVAGVDEAVEELHEIKEFLENPKKFQALGARIPKGVLLYGPPGTGKTLLARAVAGEAGVPSSRSPGRTSSRCSSAWAPRACVTSSSRPSRTRPASSSWTRSTPSVVTAARVSAAATTSASRR